MSCHKTVKVWNRFYQKDVDIDEKLAPLLELLWESGIETFSCCQEYRPALAMISFLDTYGIETFYYVAKRTYFLNTSAYYHQDKQGNCDYCHASLDVYFPSADIPRLIEAFTVCKEENAKEKQSAVRKTPPAKRSKRKQ